MAQADTQSHSKFHEEDESLVQVKALTYEIFVTVKGGSNAGFETKMCIVHSCICLCFFSGLQLNMT